MQYAVTAAPGTGAHGRAPCALQPQDSIATQEMVSLWSVDQMPSKDLAILVFVLTCF